MSSHSFTAANLHDPVLPFVRPVSVPLRATQAVAEAHAAVRAAASAWDIR